jgi:hypothetical protein
MKTKQPGNYVYGLMGILGGLLCAAGDILYDHRGPNNQTTGKYGIIETNWINMAHWRFTVSILLATIGVLLFFWCFIGLKNQLEIRSKKTAKVFWLFSSTGSLGALFIHASLCYLPIIYKTILAESNFELAEKVINNIYEAIMLPFFVLYGCLIFVPSIILIIAIIKNYINIPKWYVLFNPLVFLMLGIAFRKIDAIQSFGLPGIMPSLGIAAMGLCLIKPIKTNEELTSPHLTRTSRLPAG